MMNITENDRKNKKVAIFCQAVKLADEVAGLDRTAYIAEMLSNSGYDVTLITSSFQHWEKDFRDTKQDKYHSLPYSVVFLDEPGYNRNISPKRIYSHSILSKNLDKYIRENLSDYDLLWTQIPPNDGAAVIARFASDMKIPMIVDVNDLWPEAMRMVINVPIVSDLLFRKFTNDACIVFENASAVVGTSDEYALHPGRCITRDIQNITVYVGGNIKKFDDGIKQHQAIIDSDFEALFSSGTSQHFDERLVEVSSCSIDDADDTETVGAIETVEAVETDLSDYDTINELGDDNSLNGGLNAARTPQTRQNDAAVSFNDNNNDKKPYRIAYAGTLGKSYDIARLIDAYDDAYKSLCKLGYEPHLIIMGDGPDKQKLIELANQKKVDVSFLGYVDYGRMAAILSQCDVLVNSLVMGAPQSIVSKIGDYLAAGKPMINTGESHEFKKKVEKDGFGINVIPGYTQPLSEAIVYLAEHPQEAKEMGIKARAVAEKEFDREESYKRIAELVDETIFEKKMKEKPKFSLNKKKENKK